MRLLVQRAAWGSVQVGERITAVSRGFVIFAGIEEADGPEDIAWLVSKVIRLRVFDGADGKRELSLLDIGGDVLLISQFTLHASTKKGTRPSFHRAARPERAGPLFDALVAAFEAQLGRSIATGEFGAMMRVELCNDGPVTLWLDSKARE